MQKRLADEGVWVEPASAAGVAGLAAELQAGKLDVKGQRIVAVCTGHGMKDPDIVTRNLPTVRAIAVEVETLERAIMGGI
jgi:threonine synthase